MAINIMVDIETLSQLPTAAIVSIGAVKFDTETGNIIDKFYTNVDPVSCKNLGLRIDQSTIDWWRKENPEAMKQWREDGKQLPEALQSFCNWVGGKDQKFWAHGSNFDFPILINALNVCGIKEPWRYYNLQCSRTVMNLANIALRDKRAEEGGGTYHNAVDDCVFQVKWLMNVFKGKI